MKHTGKADFRFFAVITLAHLVFFVLAMHFSRIYMGDSYEYVYMALNIRDRFDFYAANPALPVMLKNYTLRPPGYSLFLLLVYLFTVNNWVVIVLQNLLSLFNIMYLRHTLMRLGYQRSNDGWLLLFVLAYPAQYIFANTVAPDLLLQTCVLVYFRHGILLVQERQLRHAWISSAALTWGLFTKPILLMFIPLHVLLLVLAWRRFGMSGRGLSALLLPVCSVLAYNAWNLQRTGKFHFTSIQPHNALFYNVRMFQEERLGREQAARYMAGEEKKLAATETFADWYDHGNRVSSEFLKRHFLSYMAFHIKHSFQFFIHPGRGELDLFTGDLTYGRFFSKTGGRIWQELQATPVSEWPRVFAGRWSVPVMFIILFFNMLKVLGALCFLGDGRFPLWCRMFLVIILGYFAFMTGPLANTRYHLPVSLLFIGCAALGWNGILQRMKNKRIITA